MYEACSPSGDHKMLQCQSSALQLAAKCWTGNTKNGFLYELPKPSINNTHPFIPPTPGQLQLLSETFKHDQISLPSPISTTPFLAPKDTVQVRAGKQTTVTM